MYLWRYSDDDDDDGCKGRCLLMVYLYGLWLKFLNTRQHGIYTRHQSIMWLVSVICAMRLYAICVLVLDRGVNVYFVGCS